MALKIKPLLRPQTPLELTAWENFKSIKDSLGEIVAGTGVTVTNNGDGTITVAASGLTWTGTAGRVTYWTGANALGGSANFLFTDTSGAGADTTATVGNSDNTNAASHAVVTIQVGGTSGGDPKVVFSIPSGTSWSAGPDNSASDAFVISEGTALGTTNDLSIAVGGAISIPRGNLDVTRSLSAGDVTATVSNTNNSNGGSNAVVQLTTGGGSGGDPYVSFQVTGGSQWLVGIDNSVSDQFRIGFGSNFSSATILMDCTSTTVAFGKDTYVQRSDSGNTVLLHVANLTGGSDLSRAVVEIQTSGSTGGDPYVRFIIGSGVTWSLGSDNTDGDAFVLAESASPGTTNRVRIASGGDTSFLSATDATSPTAASFILAGGLGVAKKTFFGDDVNVASGKVYKVNAVQVLTAQQTGMGAALAVSTAGGTYTGTEQTMLQDVHDKARLMLAALKVHGLLAA